MSIRIEKSAFDNTVRLDGDMTFSSLPTFNGFSQSHFTQSGVRYVFDMEGVNTIDSAGLGMLLVARKRAREAQAEIILSRPSPAINAELASAEMNGLFQIEP